MSSTKSRKKLGKNRRLGKRRRGSGNRGGFGRAGAGKRSSQKEQRYKKEIRKPRGKGNKKVRSKLIGLNFNEVNKLVNNKVVKFNGKILSKGNPISGVKYVAKAFSKKALEKIKKANAKHEIMI